MLNTETGRFKTSYAADMAIQRVPLARVFFWGLIGATFLVVPRVFDNVWINNFNLILCAIVAVTGLNLLVGYTGQISLGHAAFAMVGAFTVALLYDRFPGLRTNPLQLLITLPAAGLVATAVGTLFGVPSLRVKGLYLAIATLAAHPILTWVIEHLVPKLTERGRPFSSLPIRRPLIGIPGGWEHTIRSDVEKYYLFAVIAVLGIIVAQNILRTRVGRAFIAIRDNDIAAESVGISLYKYKLMAFAVSSFYAGVAGAMLAYYFDVATVETFPISRSVEFLAMVIIGGMGAIPGSILGAGFIILAPILVRDYVVDPISDQVPRLRQYYDYVREMIFGLLIVLFIIWEPQGLYRLWTRLKGAVRSWPFTG